MALSQAVFLDTYIYMINRKIILIHKIDGTEVNTYEFTHHDTFVFGRAEDVNCRITNDKEISRHHFLLEVNPPNALLRDLGSTNGTYVNGIKFGGKGKGKQAVHEPCSLKHGDIIKAGKTILDVIVFEPKYCRICKDLLPPEHNDTDRICEQCRKRSRTALIDMEVVDQFIDDTREISRDMINLSKIPDYEIIEELAQGGMGKVYLVKHLPTNEKRILKTILSAENTSKSAMKLFQREIGITRKLNHKNIVHLYDYGIVDNTMYFVVEYMPDGDAGSLQESIGGKLPLPMVSSIAMQILEGLSHAHTEGYIHRDIKPSNILLKRNEHNLFIAKLADFGLAKNFELSGLSGFTTSSFYGGTPFFMPREQITNYRNVFPTSDVFSMGATIYYFLTSEMLYDDMRVDPIIMVLEGVIVPIDKRLPAIPPFLANVINKAISIDPNQRYKDASEMLLDFRKACYKSGLA